MANQFSSGKFSIADCDRCGQRYKLSQLKELVVKTKKTDVYVCPECWEPDQPQLLIGLYPITDPQAVRNPRPDNSRNDTSAGSRDFQWGWAPVGGSELFDVVLTPNNLVATAAVGTVTIAVT